MPDSGRDKTGVDMVRVEIDSIRVSLMSQQRIVILRDVASDRYLPIWIGPCEAEAITLELKGVKVARPLTHDLLKSVIGELGGTVDHILVSDLRNETFYARVFVSVNGQTLEIDSRPSDAIALAVRSKVPIYVADSVMERASITPEVAVDDDLHEGPEGAAEEEGLEIFKDFLDSLDLDDLGSEEEDD